MVFMEFAKSAIELDAKLAYFLFWLDCVLPLSANWFCTFARRHTNFPQSVPLTVVETRLENAVIAARCQCSYRWNTGGTDMKVSPESYRRAATVSKTPSWTCGWLWDYRRLRLVWTNICSFLSVEITIKEEVRKSLWVETQMFQMLFHDQRELIFDIFEILNIWTSVFAVLISRNGKEPNSLRHDS